jgi:alpha-glucosidase
MHRKYPNLINYEAVFGLEQVKWGDSNRDFMRHDTIIPFTRMVAGPMDYTAGAMKNQTRKHFKPNFELPGAQGTRVHQMTLLMLLEGPLQMMCDSPSEYLKNPECTEFLSQIPTKWDEVIGIDGEPGQFCILARRVGDLVYIGAIGNWDKREVELDLSTVLAKKNYTATIFKDGINADRNPEDWKKEIRTVNGADKIKIVLQPGGGWIGRFELAQ